MHPSSPVAPSHQKVKPSSSSLDDRTTSSVPLSTYKTYLSSVRSLPLLLLTLATYLSSNLFQARQQSILSGLSSGSVGPLKVCAIVVAVSQFLRSALTTTSGIRASQFYHNSMLSSLTTAPASFYTSTPPGQIVNRFSNEVR